MQVSSDTRDSSVTTCTLTVTDFNLFSSAIQEDTMNVVPRSTGTQIMEQTINSEV